MQDGGKEEREKVMKQGRLVGDDVGKGKNKVRNFNSKFQPQECLEIRFFPPKFDTVSLGRKT